MFGIISNLNFVAQDYFYFGQNHKKNCIILGNPTMRAKFKYKAIYRSILAVCLFK